MNKKRKVHDGIVGLVIAVGVALGYWVAPVWLLVPGVVGVLMVQSAFTGFCPVYFTLDLIGMKDDAPGAAKAT